MAEIKSHTDLEQSKKLAEILPIESADMWYAYYYDTVSNTSSYDVEPLFHKPVCNPEQSIPCWSLAALLGILPITIHRDKEESSNLELMKGLDKNWHIAYTGELPMDYWLSARGKNLIDICYEMILELHEQNIL